MPLCSTLFFAKVVNDESTRISGAGRQILSQGLPNAIGACLIIDARKCCRMCNECQVLTRPVSLRFLQPRSIPCVLEGKKKMEVSNISG